MNLPLAAIGLFRAALARPRAGLDNPGMIARCTPRFGLTALRVAVLALLSLTAGCRMFGRTPKVTFASDPPGARVLVDQADSGFVTPCVLALDLRDDTRVDFVYPGFRTATRWLSPDRETYVLYRREMYVRSDIWMWYFWLNTQDFFVPIKTSTQLEPARVYVRLERSADST